MILLKLLWPLRLRFIIFILLLLISKELATIRKLFDQKGSNAFWRENHKGNLLSTKNVLGYVEIIEHKYEKSILDKNR